MTKIGTNIDEAVELLKASELVAIPTETVYGLAANALDAAAVIKIYEAKNRPSFNPLIIHVANHHAISNYAIIDPISSLLAKPLCLAHLHCYFLKNQLFQIWLQQVVQKLQYVFQTTH
jgi:tRNA A37 threonylcarbamoyladenosine synthetase subunit TsaC/SUA5/YrdC